MSRKNKYSYEQKLWAVEQYLNSNMSAVEIAKQLNMTGKHGNLRIREWGQAIKIISLIMPSTIGITLRNLKIWLCRNI